MNFYEKPQIEIIKFNSQDIITTSYEQNPIDDDNVNRLPNVE
ncbi:MAG: hypothetical protein ACI4WH_01575 [Oscillospiraceae bacterium]